MLFLRSVVLVVAAAISSSRGGVSAIPPTLAPTTPPPTTLSPTTSPTDNSTISDSDCDGCSYCEDSPDLTCYPGDLNGFPACCADGEESCPPDPDACVVEPPPFLPECDGTNTMAQTICPDPNPGGSESNTFPILCRFLLYTGLLELLNDPTSDVTLWAITDETFTRELGGLIDFLFLDQRGKDFLNDILRVTIAPKVYRADELTCGLEIETVEPFETTRTECKSLGTTFQVGAQNLPEDGPPPQYLPVTPTPGSPSDRNIKTCNGLVYTINGIIRKNNPFSSCNVCDADPTCFPGFDEDGVQDVFCCKDPPCCDPSPECVPRFGNGEQLVFCCPRTVPPTILPTIPPAPTSKPTRKRRPSKSSKSSKSRRTRKPRPDKEMVV